MILNLPPPGYGLLNGGHTQLAIKNALRDSAATDTLVRVGDVWRIHSGRNRSGC